MKSIQDREADQQKKPKDEKEKQTMLGGKQSRDTNKLTYQVGIEDT